MITINTDKGLVKVEGWDDVLERPGFTDNLNPLDHELGAIIGRYLFSDKVRCGLSDCHTPHTRGYLVATKTGLETNIGKDCGSKYFGVDFDEQAQQFERDLAEKDNRELLSTVRFGIERLETRIETLRAGDDGARWVHKNGNALRNPGRTPLQITRAIDDMVRQKNGQLAISRVATEEETERSEVMSGRSLARPLVDVMRPAEIRGIAALYRENDLRELLTVQLEERIKEFKEIDIDSASLKVLTHWSKWSQSIEHILNTARESVAHGRVLLTQHNLTPMLRKLYPKLPADAARFNEFLAALPA